MNERLEPLLAYVAVRRSLEHKNDWMDVFRLTDTPVLAEIHARQKDIEAPEWGKRNPVQRIATVDIREISKDRSPNDLVCPDCGHDGLRANAWIAVNTGEVIEAGPSSERFHCPECDSNFRPDCAVTRVWLENARKAQGKDWRES